MKLSPLSNLDVARLLKKQFDKELNKIKSILATTVKKEVLDADKSNINSVIESLKFDLAQAQLQSSDESLKVLNALERKLNNLNSKADFDELQNQLRDLAGDVMASIAKLKSDKEQSDLDDNAEFDAVKNRIMDLEEEIDLLERRMPQSWLIPQGGGGGNVELRYNGEVVTTQARCLNFTGDDVLVAPNPDEPECYDIYIPPPPFALDFFNANPNLVEAGNVVNDVNLNWDWTVTDVINQVLTGPGTYTPVTDAERSRLVTMLNNDLTNQTWTIAAEDPLSGLTDSGNVRLLFGLNAYFGKAPVPTTEAEVLALTATGLQTGHDGDLNFPTSPTPQFMIYAFPQAWGSTGTVIDPVTGFQIPTVLEGTIDITNGFGYKNRYQIQRSFQQTAGAFEWNFNSTGPVQLPASLP